MKRYRAGQYVEPGFYLNTRTLQLTAIGPQGGKLGGPELSWHVKIPAILMLGLAPLLGAAYVIFLPLAGFAMLFRFASGKAVEGARAAAQGLGALSMPGLRLGAAYFHRRRDPESKGPRPNPKG
jgi:hypothetical protein